MTDIYLMPMPGFWDESDHSSPNDSMCISQGSPDLSGYRYDNKKEMEPARPIFTNESFEEK